MSAEAGQPLIEGARVAATVERGEKIIIFRKSGGRTIAASAGTGELTVLRIDEILAAREAARQEVDRNGARGDSRAKPATKAKRSQETRKTAAAKVEKPTPSPRPPKRRRRSD